jgi:hypothetical protein
MNIQKILLFCLLLLVACGQAEPEPVALATVTPTATILPTNTAVVSLAERETPTAAFSPAPITTVTPTPRPTPTPVIPHLLATAAYIVVDDWSVDGQWLAYWLSSTADVDNTQPYTSPGGRLYVTNAHTGQSCALPHFHATAAGQFSLEWQPDNNLIVHNRETYQQWRLRPCQPGTFPVPAQPPPERVFDGGLSPNGRFRITTELQDEADNILTFVTSLSHTDGVEITSLTWHTYEAKGEWDLGGDWVSPGQFLIRRSLDGPLLLDAARPGQVINVQRDLFGLKTVREDVTISAAPGADADSYRLLLNFWGDQEDVQLFHAATGLVEMLPYTEPWWPPFTPDGQWLLLQEESANNLWARPAADVGGAWRLVATGAADTLWHRDGAQMAFSSRLPQGIRGITWQTFPDAELIGQWPTVPYQVRPVGWSPDGRFLVAVGPQSGRWQYALFVFEAHP